MTLADGRIFYVYRDQYGCSRELETAAMEESALAIEEDGLQPELLDDMSEYFHPACRCKNCQKNANQSRLEHMLTAIDTGKQFGYKRCCITHWILAQCGMHIEDTESVYSDEVCNFWNASQKKVDETIDAVVKSNHPGFFPCHECKIDLASFITEGKRSTRRVIDRRTKQWFRRYKTFY